MPAFTSSSVRPRQELALAIVEGEGSPSACVGSKILPDFGINRRNAHLIKLLLKDTMASRPISADKYIHTPGTKYERAVITFSDASLTVILRALELVIPNEVELDYAGYLSVEQVASSRFGNDTSLITKEILIAAAIFSTDSTTGFGSATAAGVNYTLANLTTISFIADIIAATRRLKAKLEMPPYKVMIAGPVAERVRQAATVQAYAAGTLKAGQEATLAQITASLREFGVDEIVVGDAYYVSSADGATPTTTQVWSNTYIWVGKPGLSATQSMTGGVGVPTIGGVGVNAFWEGWIGGKPVAEVPTGIVPENFAGGNFVESYYDPSIDSVVCRVKVSATPFIGNTRAGDLISTSYS